MGRLKGGKRLPFNQRREYFRDELLKRGVSSNGSRIVLKARYLALMRGDNVPMSQKIAPMKQKKKQQAKGKRKGSGKDSSKGASSKAKGKEKSSGSGDGASSPSKGKRKGSGKDRSKGASSQASGKGKRSGRGGGASSQGNGNRKAKAEQSEAEEPKRRRITGKTTPLAKPVALPVPGVGGSAGTAAELARTEYERADAEVAAAAVKQERADPQETKMKQETKEKEEAEEDLARAKAFELYKELKKEARMLMARDIPEANSKLLVTYLAHENPLIVTAAMLAMRVIGHAAWPIVSQHLQTVLMHEDAEVRAVAQETLNILDLEDSDEYNAEEEERHEKRLQRPRKASEWIDMREANDFEKEREESASSSSSGSSESSESEAGDNPEDQPDEEAFAASDEEVMQTTVQLPKGSRT